MKKHTHLFKEKGDIIWCKCGGFKDFSCQHFWRVHSEQEIKAGTERVSQTRQILVCRNCGELKSVNLTTGEIK